MAWLALHHTGLLKWTNDFCVQTDKQKMNVWLRFVSGASVIPVHAKEL